MNLNLGAFSVVTWTWRVLRGHSITFAVLFALAVLGVPVLGEFRHLLARFGATWYVWLFVPVIVVGYVAKKETQWVPEITTRQKWARRVFFGSILLAIVLSKTGLTSREPPQTSPPADVSAPVSK